MVRQCAKGLKGVPKDLIQHNLDSAALPWMSDYQLAICYIASSVVCGKQPEDCLLCFQRSEARFQSFSCLYTTWLEDGSLLQASSQLGCLLPRVDC
jgi:hypothetical protein